jgi:hypothetical protein
VEDLCKPPPLADGLNFEPTSASDLQVRAGNIILHPKVLARKENFGCDARGGVRESYDELCPPLKEFPRQIPARIRQMRTHADPWILQRSLTLSRIPGMKTGVALLLLRI